MSPTNVDTEIKARERQIAAKKAADQRKKDEAAAESTQATLDLQLSEGSSHNPPSHVSMWDASIQKGAFDSSWIILKETHSQTNHCSEKGCFAHAKRIAPEDGKPYCDICVSQHMKEPKPEQPEDKAKKVGVR